MFLIPTTFVANQGYHYYEGVETNLWEPKSSVTGGRRRQFCRRVKTTILLILLDHLQPPIAMELPLATSRFSEQPGRCELPLMARDP